MPLPELPLVIETNQLQRCLGQENLLLVDLSQPATYVQYHIPGAVFLDYSWIVRVELPAWACCPTRPSSPMC